MSKNIISPLLLLLAFAAINLGFAQDVTKSVFKKYTQADSASVNQSSVLTLYTDNTFLNYGIVKDYVTQDSYVWYTFGNWIMNKGEITCTSYFGAFNHKSVIDTIRDSYKNRVDFGVLDTYYDFKNEQYLNYSIFLNKITAIDKQKGIQYRDICYSVN